MRVERSIGTGPRRSTEQACVTLAQFVAKVLADRAYPDAAKAASSFEGLFPLLRLLFSTRKFGEPAITITMPDLQVDILVSYSPDFEEDLTPPNVILLDRLSANDVIHIAVHSTGDIASPLQGLPASVSSDKVRFSFGPPEDAPFPDLATSDAGIPDTTVPDDIPGPFDEALPDRDGILPQPQRDDTAKPDAGDTDPLVPNSGPGEE
jgi:hypothetical protein